MNKEKIFQLLMMYSECHDLCRALSKEAISKFEQQNKISLPQEMKDLYGCFDGGEIFIPGTILYGLMPSKKRKTVKEANSKLTRSKLNIPNTYLVIAKLNFGDLICVNLNAPYDVVQWDHESNEKYCFWDSIYDWLDETIRDYRTYEEGAE
jgi:hypothetical protein